MIDTANIRKHMLHAEYEKARSIFEQCKGECLPNVMAAAIAYRAGLVEGKAMCRDRIKSAYKRLNEAREQAEQLIDNWLSDTMEEYAQLSPEKQIEEIESMRSLLDQMEANARSRMNSPTSGDEMEDQNNG